MLFLTFYLKRVSQQKELPLTLKEEPCQSSSRKLIGDRGNIATKIDKNTPQIHNIWVKSAAFPTISTVANVIAY